MRSSKVKEFFVFLSKLLLCMLPLAVWLIYIMCFPFLYMDSEYPYWKQQRDYIYSRHEAVDLVVIGDSIAKSSYIPKEMEGINTINLGLGGATPIEMYYTLKVYLQNNDKPKYVVCTYNPNSLKVNNQFINRTLYFRYLTYSQIQEISRVGKSLNESEFYGSEFNKTVLSYYLGTPQKYLPSVFNATFVGRRSINRNGYNSVQEDLGFMLFGLAEYCGNISSLGDDYFECRPINKYYLDKTIELCNQNGIEFIYEPAAVNAATYQYYIQTNLKKSIETFYLSLSTQYNNPKINHTILQFSDDCFGDEAHLNMRGAQQYTKLFMEKLRRFGYVK